MSENSRLHPKTASVLAVASGKGGVGKSVISINLGIALAKHGKKVCVFDADTNLANINILLGVQPERTIENVLSGENTVDEVLLDGPEGVQFVSAASGAADLVRLNKDQRERLLMMMQQLESQFDYVIIDTAAGTDKTVLALLMAAPTTLMVITPEPTSLTDAFSVLRLLTQRGLELDVKIIVNQAFDLDSAQKIFNRFRKACQTYLGLKVSSLGYVAQDRFLPAAVRKQTPIMIDAPYTPAARCITAMSRRLEASPTDRDKIFSEIFDRLTGKLNPVRTPKQSAPPETHQNTPPRKIKKKH